MKLTKIVSILTIGLFLCSSAVFAADIAATLTVGEVEGGAGVTVSVPVTISDDDSKAAGLAVTLTYDAALTFAGLEQADPQAISDPEADALEDADVLDSTLYYQANDDGAGTVKIAAAAATAVVTGVVFNAKFTIPTDAEAGTVYDVTATQTNITNAAAGYETPTDIEVLCGVPDDTGTVADTFTTTLVAGKVTVPDTIKGDPVGDDGKTTIADVLKAISFMNQAAVTAEQIACDMDDANGVTIADILKMIAQME